MIKARPSRSMPDLVLAPPKHLLCTPPPAAARGRIRVMTPKVNTKTPNSKTKKGESKKGKSARSKAANAKQKMQKESTKKGAEEGKAQGAEGAQGAEEGKAREAKSARATSSGPSCAANVERKQEDQEEKARVTEEQWGWDAKEVDFGSAANRKWARSTLLNRHLLPETRPTNPSRHESTGLKKLEVKSRPGNRLIQIMLSGKVVGQVTENSYKAEGVTFAAAMLQYVVGAGYDKEVFTAVKKGLLRAD
jgi:hypothetical protein